MFDQIARYCASLGIWFIGSDRLYLVREAFVVCWLRIAPIKHPAPPVFAGNAPHHAAKKSHERHIDRPATSSIQRALYRIMQDVAPFHPWQSPRAELGDAPKTSKVRLAQSRESDRNLFGGTIFIQGTGVCRFHGSLC
ncbi:hypothetical protein C9427_13200 [Mesorhizobium helmanticense]|uniref:Uncharacterized protein n=1 Tax=Mesorhizobium helmanticense TaxID=1776423 RepID=A0A2T4IWP4_9HYPH|nr:hypothetical protein C9427_13200 [Mesorhizobium helmanticense]